MSDFEWRVQQMVRERDALRVEAGHQIWCSRCKAEDFTATTNEVDAQDSFYVAGWRPDGPRQLCPLCA